MQTRPTTPVDKEEAALDAQQVKEKEGAASVTSASLFSPSRHRDPGSSTKFGTQGTAPINPVTHFPGRCTR